MEGLSIERTNRLVVAAWNGEITIDVTPGLKAELERVLEKGGFDCLVLDLSAVDFIDSSGIGFLVSLASRIDNDAKSFYLYRPGPQVEKTLELVRLRKYFKMLNTEDELAPLKL